MSPHCSHTGKARQGKVSVTSRFAVALDYRVDRIGRADVVTRLSVPRRLIERRVPLTRRERLRQRQADPLLQWAAWAALAVVALIAIGPM
jgi:hypothetical protein